MKNVDLLKKKLCEKINELEDKELYEAILQPKPLITGLCKYCEPLWGRCPDTLEDDSMCIARFVAWCEMESNTASKNDESERL